MKILLTLLSLGSLWPSSAAFCQSPARYPIIPRPARLTARPDDFPITQTTVVRVPVAPSAVRTIAENFVAQLNRSSGLDLPITYTGTTPAVIDGAAGRVIDFVPVTDSTLGGEGYRLAISPEGVQIEAAQPAGFFYAVQSLYQLLPPAVLRSTRSLVPLNPVLPACQISDRPRYAYRGMHLDVARHFFGVSFIKKYLDLMALHKFNTFHWHLTDDQGWRIDIKQYPRLTQTGANRTETLIGHYDDDNPQRFDGKPYGGFYTQDDIREIVRYAQDRYITIVPEIEMPGHALAALAAYPSLGCEGKGYAVATKWGVFGSVFCPTEATFTFLENVLTEVMALFPGPYIHIGGDECPKSTWRHSPFCQQLMKRLRLRTENQLQHYFIRRIDRFLTANGRKTIGWDEILQGSSGADMSRGTTIMNWHGVNGGLDAARQGHDVVMTPGAFCYFDHYQADPAQEPTGFGEYLPLSKVYGYNPTPASLTPGQARHILGTQGNLWTEYTATPQQVEYMIWPRAAALAEVAWTPTDQKDYVDFGQRLPALFARLTSLDVNFSRSVYEVTFVVAPTPEGKLAVTLAGHEQTPDIYYTLDGTTPTPQSTRYTAPILLDASATVRAIACRQGQPMGTVCRKSVLVSKATGKPYRLLASPTASRPDQNGQLTNGLVGEMGGYELANIVSFRAPVLGVVLDLGQVRAIQTVTAGFLNYSARDICLPAGVDVTLSDDGITFGPPQTVRPDPARDGHRGLDRLTVVFPPSAARYVRIAATSVRRVPAGLRRSGHASLLAIDEITVE